MSRPRTTETIWSDGSAAVYGLYGLLSLVLLAAGIIELIRLF